MFYELSTLSLTSGLCFSFWNTSGEVMHGIHVYKLAGDLIVYIGPVCMSVMGGRAYHWREVINLTCAAVLMYSYNTQTYKQTVRHINLSHFTPVWVLMGFPLKGYKLYLVLQSRGSTGPKTLVQNAPLWHGHKFMKRLWECTEIDLLMMIIYFLFLFHSCSESPLLSMDLSHVSSTSHWIIAYKLHVHVVNPKLTHTHKHTHTLNPV